MPGAPRSFLLLVSMLRSNPGLRDLHVSPPAELRQATLGDGRHGQLFQVFTGAAQGHCFCKGWGPRLDRRDERVKA